VVDTEKYYGSPIESAAARGVGSPSRSPGGGKRDVWQGWALSKTADIDHTFKKKPGYFSPKQAESPPRNKVAPKVEARQVPEMIDSLGAAQGKRHLKSSWRETAPPELVAALGRPDPLTRRTIRALQGSDAAGKNRGSHRSIELRSTFSGTTRSDFFHVESNSVCSTTASHLPRPSK